MKKLSRLSKMRGRVETHFTDLLTRNGRRTKKSKTYHNAKYEETLILNHRRAAKPRAINKVNTAEKRHFTFQRRAKLAGPRNLHSEYLLPRRVYGRRSCFRL